MSAFTEAVPLDGISLREDVSCECFLDDGSACGKPATLRLTSRCKGCRHTVSAFACVPCWNYIRPYIISTGFLCRWCLAPRTVTSRGLG